MGVIAHSNKVEAEQYASYMAKIASYEQPILTTEKGAALQLPDEEMQLWFAGTEKLNGYDRVALASQQQSRTTQGYLTRVLKFQLEASAPSGTRYGPIDLGPEFGILVRLYVLSVNQNEIKYVATSYKK